MSEPNHTPTNTPGPCDIPTSRLIAAAPALLASLIAILDNRPQCSGDRYVMVEFSREVLTNARAAIAKATGEG